MGNLVDAFIALRQELAVPAAMVAEIALRFQEEMIAGLRGQLSTLKMLPSFLAKPNGEEKGDFLAIDFGGTNVRIILVELSGQGRFSIKAARSFPLKDRQKGYDYTANTASGNELFDFIAANIEELADRHGRYSLGHTFSFPCRQTGLNQAILIIWTKEIKTQGVEGQDVGTLLQAALDQRQMTHVVAKAIINDTVGTLLAAAYSDRWADIGSICGTGHNTCYLEPCSPLTGKPMIINMESGNFDKIAVTEYDRLLDQASEKPGKQRLEKMSSGRYVGELVSIISSQYGKKGLLGTGFQQPAGLVPLGGEQVAALVADNTPGLTQVQEVIEGQWGASGSTLAERQAIREIAELVINRSARLVAATFLGVIRHIDPELQQRHTIAIDGSLYEKMPGYASRLKAALAENLAAKASLITVVLTKDGSGVGAAIAAAIADQ